MKNFKVLTRLKTVSDYPDGFRGYGHFSFNLIFDSKKYPKLAKVVEEWTDNGLEENYKGYDFCAFLTFCCRMPEGNYKGKDDLKYCECYLSLDEDGFDEKGNVIEDVTDTLPSSAFKKLVEKVNKALKDIDLYEDGEGITFDLSKLDKTPSVCYPWNKSLNKAPAIFLD